MSIRKKFVIQHSAFRPYLSKSTLESSRRFELLDVEIMMLETPFSVHFCFVIITRVMTSNALFKRQNGQKTGKSQKNFRPTRAFPE